MVTSKLDIMSMQVGCPEGRIDENVAKLTAAGHKVTAGSTPVKPENLALLPDYKPFMGSCGAYVSQVRHDSP